jgi:hypothetical protein
MRLRVISVGALYYGAHWTAPKRSHTKLSASISIR